MAWMWWLLAPLASTAVGASALWLRAHRDARRRGGVGRSSIDRHRAMLLALAARHESVALPATMVPVSHGVAGSDAVNG